MLFTKKYNTIVIVLLMAFCFSALAETIDLMPVDDPEATGTVRFVGFTFYDFTNQWGITTGQNMISDRMRGYTIFEIADLPQGATVTAIDLTFFVSIEGGFDHLLNIHELTTLPDGENAETVWDAMAGFYTDEASEACRVTGENTIALNEDSIIGLQAALDAGDTEWGIGFREDNDTAMMATIAGNETDSPPVITVTYDGGAPAEPVVVDVLNEEYGTGSVMFWQNIYNTMWDTPEIKCGYSLTGQEFRGFARFDIAGLEEDMVLDSIIVDFNVVWANGTTIDVTSLDEDPNTATAEEVWNCMNDAYYVEGAASDLGAHSHAMSEDAITSLQAAIINGDDVWGIGFIGSGGQFNTTIEIEGYTNDSPPILTIYHGGAVALIAP